MEAEDVAAALRALVEYDSNPSGTMHDLEYLGVEEAYEETAFFLADAGNKGRFLVTVAKVSE